MAEPGADILVVGGPEPTTEGARAALDEAGHNVRSTPDGEAGLEELRRRPPDVVVTEWEMPRLDGLDLCRAVRADPELGGTHVIVLTTGGSGSRTVEELEAGADDYVTIPFDEAELLARVRTGRRPPSCGRAKRGCGR